MADELLKSTLKGLQETSKGRLKTEFIFDGTATEEQMSILEPSSAPPPWSPQIEIWLRKKPRLDNEDTEHVNMEKLARKPVKMSTLSLEEEFFELNLSVDEQISKEIEDKERNLDDEMWSESRKHIEVVMSVLNITKKENDEQSFVVMEKMDNTEEVCGLTERHRMLEKHLFIEAQDVRKKYLEECKTENEVKQARIQSGEEESRRIQLELLEKRRYQLYEECMEEYRVLFKNFEDTLNSCSHRQCLHQDVLKQSQDMIRALHYYWADVRAKTKMAEQQIKQYQEKLCGIRTFLVEILTPAVKEANAIGSHLQKVKLEEARMKQEQQKLEQEKLKQEKLEQERLKKEKLEKELLEKKRQEQEKLSQQKQLTSTSTPTSTAVVNTTAIADGKKLTSSDKTNQADLQSKMSIPVSAITLYTDLQQKLAEVSSKNTLSTTTDTATKQYRFQLQKTIGLTVNGLSTNNGEVLIEKITRVKDLLKGKTLTVMGKQVSTAKHSGAALYCSNLLAMKLVKQGEDEVSSNPSAAFPLAALIISLFTNFPDLGELILAHLHSQCPVLVPLYIREDCGIPKAEYLKLQGYKVSSDKTVETEDEYLRRICGMVRLYAAVISSPQLPIEHSPHPHGPSHGWAWLARIINMEPHPTLTAAALGSFLEVAGHSLMKVYGKQFKKLLYVLYKECMPKIEKCTPSSQKGPYQRLAQFLDNCVKTGRFPEPKGFLQRNFWMTKNKGVSYA